MGFRVPAATARRLWQALLALSLLYAGTSSALYVFGAYPRHRVESGWIVFSALFVATALGRWSFAAPLSRVSADRRVLPAMLLGALLLYAPSLAVGLFSDDYVLLAASDRWDLTPAWDHFRPLSLAIWASLTALGAGAPGLHAINILLHGLNGYLTYWLGRELGASAATALAAGALWLAFPGSVEPVTWLSGVQDVLMAALIMSFLIAAVRGGFLVSIACLMLATFTKETAVCGPVLLLLLRCRRHIATRTIVVALAWCVLFAFARLYFKASEGLFEPLTGYFVKELLAGLFGSLAMPWTREQMFQYPWLMATLVAAIAAVLALAIVRVTDKDLWTSAAIWAAWALVAALPVYRYLYISPELQGSRYLYLPAAGWSLLLASVAFRHAFGRVAVVILLAGGSIGTIVQQQRWRAAGQYRDGVLNQAVTQARALGCSNPEFRNGPDSYAGVYVFRNGIREATTRLGISGPGSPVDCVFDWKQDNFLRIEDPGPLR